MATIKEIAENLNISIGTVDRALHGRGRVSKATAERVFEEVERLGYKPNVHASQLKRGRSYQFAVITPHFHQDFGYWNLIRNGVVQAQQELASLKMEISFFTYDRYKSETLLEIGKNNRLQSFEGVVIAPVLEEASQILQSDYPETPFIYIDCKTDGPCISHIGQDAFQSGVVAGMLMKRMLHDPATILCVEISPFDVHIGQRIEGFSSCFKDASQHILKIHSLDGNAPSNLFAEELTSLTSDIENLKAIFVTSAWTNYVVDIIHRSQHNNKPLVVGYDLVRENVLGLESDRIDSIISQKPEMQGYQGIYQLYRHVILKETIDKEIMMPIDIITKENLKYYK